MKLSKFNIYRECDGEIFIYNTLSGGILHLNQEYSVKFNKIRRDLEYPIEFEDLIKNLEKDQMLIPDSLDESEAVIMHSNIQRYSSSVYTLTIAPTMKCNFVCPYCYEANKIYPQMNKEIIDKIKELFRKAKNNHKYLSVAWYGGEPLLAFDIIEELSQEAIQVFGEDYCASIVTNGYLLNDKIIKKLESLKIMKMQITLDGPPEIHNKRRKLPNGEDTFFVILNSIKRVIELSPNTEVVIRVNTDKENIGYVDEIIGYLEQFGIEKSVGFYLAPVDNINETCNGSECFNNTEFAEEQLNFIERNLKKGYNFLHLPQANLGVCGAVCNDNYVIDSCGDIYNCWDDISRKEEKIGNIMEEHIPLIKNLTKWLNYDIREDKECIDCSYLPVCMGGCPNYRMKNKGKKCIPIKENIDEVIRVLYEISKRKVMSSDSHS